MSTRRIRMVGVTVGCAFASAGVPRKKGLVCSKKKRVLCSKCDDQNFLKFAQHVPLDSVNVW